MVLLFWFWAVALVLLAAAEMDQDDRGRLLDRPVPGQMIKPHRASRPRERRGIPRIAVRLSPRRRRHRRRSRRGTAEAARARIWSRASASVKATCVAPTPESPWDAASLPASPQRPTTIGSPANRDRSRRTW